MAGCTEQGGRVTRRAPDPVVAHHQAVAGRLEDDGGSRPAPGDPVPGA